MGIASLVLGIISIIVSLVPICGVIALFPALIGIILGIVDWVIRSKNKLKKGVPITGFILSIISICIIVTWSFIGVWMYKTNKIVDVFKYVNNEVETELSTQSK